MNGLVQQTREEIKSALQKAAEQARDQGLISFESIPDFVVEVPREKDHGDFAANLAILLTKQAKKNPREIAQVITSNIQIREDLCKDIQIAGPGFINFYLKPDWLRKIIPQVLEQGDDFGRVDIGKGKKVQVEFVSANPTGLLHMGNARGAALGDTTASVLDFAGYQVEREYYINDAGNQVGNFGKSLEARYLQLLGQEAEIPEDGYHGQDIIDTMQGLIDRDGDKYLSMSPETRRDIMVKYALAEKIGNIKKTLSDFRVEYDVWFSEQSLHDSGAITNVLSNLQERGYIYESEGALWFKATEFGDEKDEVVVRSNGIPTYFAADIAYHQNKYNRGFDWVIDVWGADHHGHVNRMRGAIDAVGYGDRRFDVILMQLVRLFRDGEVVRMSKRTGQFITLDELIEEVGLDAARYFFVMRSPDSHLEFDLDLAKSKTNENPVFYIQYAHARICSILRQLNDLGRDLPLVQETDLGLLTQDIELEIMHKLADLPEEIAGAAKDLAPHRMARYAHDLAGLFHSFYNSNRVIIDDPELSKARLLLVKAVQITLKNVLKILGVSAPERM